MKKMFGVINPRMAVLISALLAIGFAACDKDNNKQCDLVPATILRVDCEMVILRLETSELIGDASWTNIEDGRTYANVVKYRNTCKIAELTQGYTKNVIYVDPVRITNPDLPDDCFQCMAISKNPPQQWADFRVVAGECGSEF